MIRALFLVWVAAILAALFIVPDPYGNWLLVALSFGGAAVHAWSVWQDHRLAAQAPTVARLRRSRGQYYFIVMAAVFALLFVRLTITLSRTGEPFTHSVPWLILSLLLFMLPMGLASNKITEAGLVASGTLIRWESLKNPEWVRGRPSTLSFGIEIDGKMVDGKWRFHHRDVEPVTAALTRYAGYSPMAGS